MLSSFWRTPPDTNMGGRKPDPPAPLASAWKVLAEAGEPVAVVRVRNLQSALPVGRDAWGRANKVQPVLLSSEVSFARPFAQASAEDRLVDAETVHYGSLSKALLGTMGLWEQDRNRGTGQPPAESEFEAESESAATTASEARGPRTADVFELLWVRMTGRVVDGSRVELPADQVPLLDAARLRSLSLTLHLPKASLLGAGVSLTSAASFLEPPRAGAETGAKNPLRAYARTLRLHGLRVPTLVGVNPNERRARQTVVADVEIDRYDEAEDIHSDLERAIVEAMESSSFETLEALATHIGNKILSDFRVGDSPKPMKERGWLVKVVLEKPIAVPFAECPSVEVRMGA
ncbi:Dihydroneopterin aldolase-domain-containing protein [Xylariaceae sp. FL0804]|nr:Dihydroneopterin aldolase-domain-containing protein [Xylariaceae sp. FL0804]